MDSTAPVAGTASRASLPGCTCRGRNARSPAGGEPETTQRPLPRIRESIISGIERGDYSLRGADVYARGHIRVIARAVGADPGLLMTPGRICRPGSAL